MRKYLLILFLALSSSLFNLCEGQYTVLHNFNGVNGGDPRGSLALSGSKLLGMTILGGTDDSGCIFSIDTNGGEYKDLFDFNGTNGKNPWGSLIISGKVMYGMTLYGGINHDGLIFKIDTNGANYRDIWDFHNAGDSNGAFPIGDLTLIGNKLYGMTEGGGTHSSGVIFSIDTNGLNYENLWNFDWASGSGPNGSLILAGNKLYGMASGGGAHGYGIVFSIDTNGTGFKDRFDFNGIEGDNPMGSLTISGKLIYGMTTLAGTDLSHRYGNIFSLDTNGSEYRDLYDFNLISGANPYGSLTLLENRLYGMTCTYGEYNGGSIFSIDTNGSGYKTLYYFTGSSGITPLGNITLSGKELYGMTNYGGTNDSGVIFKIDTDAVTGINNLPPTTYSMTVYPNPSNGVFTVSIRNYELEITNSVEVYNILGEKVYSQFNNQQTTFNIDLSNQPNEVYFYRVIANTGELIGEGKLVIQK